MGKDSLIKSTAGKSASKKKKSTAKKAASPKKASAKFKTNAASEIKPGNPTKPNTKVTMKDLIFKQFESQKPPTSGVPVSPDFSRMTAPPFISSDDPQAVARLKALLTRRFTMADIQAAAREPEEKKAPAAPEPTQPRPVQTPESTITPPPEKEVQAPAESAEADVAPSVSVATPEATTKPAPESPSLAAEASAPKVTASAPSTAPTDPDQPTEPDQGSPSEVLPGRDNGSSSGPPSGTNGGSEDPVMRAMKFGALALGLIAILIIWASFTNSSRYYIEAERDGVTVLRGMFSPTGKRTLVDLPRITIDAPIQDVYTRQEVYPLIFEYYIANADGVLERRGLPDFAAIQAYLEQADRFALNRGMRERVNARAENLQRMQLIHLAHVEISKGTADSLEAALRNLREARRLTTDTVQLETIDQIEALVNERKAKMTPGDAPPPAAKTDQEG